MMRRRTGLGIALALLLAACGAKPEPAYPALWRVAGPHGETAWLFGTIHSLEKPALWRSPRVDAALNGSDRIVVEVANLADKAALRATFVKLSQTPGLPPLSARIPAALRPRLAAALKAAGARENQFASVETWAAALALARAGQDADDAANGIDRAILASADKKPVLELEGAEAQLGIFDRLPEPDQADLLSAVLYDADSIDNESKDLARAWRGGDMGKIEAETRKGLLARPHLREALFTARNRAWADRLSAMLTGGARPFVAVGAAHMAGPDGLPAILSAKGYEVTRVQ